MPLADPWRLAAEQALGPLLLGHELLCPHLPSAFDRLAAVMRVRTVSHAELGRCLAIARRMRKVVSIPAYAVGIVLDGTELRRLQRAGGGGLLLSRCVQWLNRLPGRWCKRVRCSWLLCLQQGGF
jgi:hypothetical protein